MQQAASPSNLSTSLKGLLHTFTDAIQDILTIARLETRLAGISLFAIVLLLFISSLLCFGIWLSILLALSIELLHLGFSWPIIALQVAGLNVVLLILAGWGIKHFIKNLMFNATRKQLRSSQQLVQEQNYAISPQEANPTAGSQSAIA